MTEVWLREFYGSKNQTEIESTVNWLKKYGIDVPEDVIDLWSHFRHLSEYQVNTLDIVPQCLGCVGNTFRSELAAHAWVNSLRVPGASEAYKLALDIVKPRVVLELGVGGDSAISTAVFLSYLEQKEGGFLVSIDRNPLGATWKRYCNYTLPRGKEVPILWTFIQDDSIKVLDHVKIKSGLSFDMVFVDTIHSYTQTTKELDIAQYITNAMLMDDCGFEGNDFDDQPGGVKRAIDEWHKKNSNWNYEEFKGRNVGLFTRKIE